MTLRPPALGYEGLRPYGGISMVMTTAPNRSVIITLWGSGLA